MTQASAAQPGIMPRSYYVLPLEGDHRSMVKFRTAIDSGYKSMVGKFRDFIERALKVRPQSGMYHV